MKYNFTFLALLIANIFFAQDMIADRTEINYGGNSNVKYIKEFNNDIFFSANRQNIGNELWKFNNSNNVKTLLKSFISGQFSCIKSRFIDYDGKLFFLATDTTPASYQLWSTDGTALGTVKVQTISNPSYNGNYPTDFKVVNGKLFFIYNNQIWVSDGTTVGTKKIAQFDGINGKLYSMANMVYFTADDGITGYDIWKSDGTVAGTELLKNINQPNFSGEIVLKEFNNYLYFFSTGSMWRTDGTTAGTTVFSNIYSNTMTGEVLNNKLVFYTSNYELFQTDGTLSGTSQIGTIYNVSKMFQFQNKVYLDTSTNIWESDGTLAGTSVSQIDSGQVLNFYCLSSDGNYVIFEEGVQTPYQYYAKKISNGTTIKPIPNSTNEDSYLEKDGLIYFSGKKYDYESELYSINYSNNIINNVADIDFYLDSRPRAFETINENTFFVATEGSLYSKQEIYKRSKITGIVSKISNFNADNGNVKYSVKVGNYYYSFQDVYGYYGSNNLKGLMRSDGTSADFINTGTSLITGAFPLNTNTLIFKTIDSGSYKIWSISNTSNLPILLLTLPNSSNTSPPFDKNYIVLNGYVYFVIKDNNVYALYKTDGTAANTVKVSNTGGLDLNYSAAGVLGLSNNNKVIYYRTPNDQVYAANSEIWVTDGSTPGTLVKTLNNYKIGRENIFFDNSNYFLAYYAGFSYLGRTDGTASGSQILSQAGSGFTSINYDVNQNTILEKCNNNLYIKPINSSPSLMKFDGAQVQTLGNLNYGNMNCINGIMFTNSTISNKIYHTNALGTTLTENNLVAVPFNYAGDQIFAVNELSNDGVNLLLDASTENSGRELFLISNLQNYLGTSELVQSQNKIEMLKVLPNPVKNSFTIMLPGDEKFSSGSIIDSAGRIVKKISSDSDDISNLNTGIYFVVVKTKTNKKFVCKIIKI